MSAPTQPTVAPARKLDGRKACRCGRRWYAAWPAEPERGYVRTCAGCHQPTRECSCAPVAADDPETAWVKARYR